MDAMEAAPAVGIDLGTTNTCITIFNDRNAEVILNSANETTTSSIVIFGSTGYSIGSNGNNIGDVSISSEIFNSKRFLGTNMKVAKNMSKSSPFVFVNDGQNRPKYQVDFKGKKLGERSNIYIKTLLFSKW